MVTIALESRLDNAINLHEIQETLREALRRERLLADTRRNHFRQLCHTFEQQYNFTSDEFLERFESGELGDAADYFDWYAAQRGADLWERRFIILTGVEV